MRFLGLELSGSVPDARTVRAFREALKQHQRIGPLFARLNQALADLGVELKSGQNHYGYKNHINIDRDTKLMTAAFCTDADMHDSQALDTLLRWTTYSA